MGSNFLDSVKEFRVEGMLLVKGFEVVGVMCLLGGVGD